MIYGFGLGGISPWSLLLILVIVIVIFGTKRLRNAGGDMGSAVKNFKKALKEGEEEGVEKAHSVKETLKQAKDDVIDATAKVKDSSNS
jgi:sec-independent protein translocase protein TatA